MSDRHGGEAQRFIGLVLLVIGVLWMAASGLCAATLIVRSISESGSTSEIEPWIPIIVFVSGLSVAVGFGVYVVGRNLRAKK